MSARRSRLSVRRVVAGAGAAALLGLPLSACGGDDTAASSSSSSGGESGAESAASTEEFCTAYNSLSESLLSGFEEGSSQDEQAQQAAGVFRDWAARITDVGVPSDTPDEARAGFELIVQTALDLPEDVSAADFQDLESSFSDAENQSAEAFGSYATETCPTQLPSDIPTDLPSQ